MDNGINIKFLKKFNPLIITFYGGLFWFILFILAPLKVKEELTLLPIVFLFLNYVFFSMGLLALSRKRLDDSIKFLPRKEVLYKVLLIILYISIIGVLLKLFDKFYLRGTDLDNTISENRVELSQSGPNFISIISAVTTPLSFLPLFIYYLGDFKRRFLFLLCLGVFFSTAFEFITVGSRSGLFVLLLLLGIYIYYFKRLRFSKRQILLGGIALYILGIFSINLFIERTTDFTKSDEKSVEHILTKANYNFTIEPTDGAREGIIKTKNETLQATKLGAINFAQYYLHGIYEFGYLYENYKTPHQYGVYTFNVFAKFTNIIFGTNIDLEEAQNSPPRIGIFTSFFGPIFIDFGWFSLIFMFIFGVVQKIIYNSVIGGKLEYLPLLFYFLLVNFFMPTINFINGAQGLYTLTAFLIFPLLYALFTKKIVIHKTATHKKFIKILK